MNDDRAGTVQVGRRQDRDVSRHVLNRELDIGVRRQRCRRAGTRCGANGKELHIHYLGIVKTQGIAWNGKLNPRCLAEHGGSKQRTVRKYRSGIGDCAPSALGVIPDEIPGGVRGPCARGVAVEVYLDIGKEAAGLDGTSVCTSLASRPCRRIRVIATVYVKTKRDSLRPGRCNEGEVVIVKVVGDKKSVECEFRLALKVVGVDRWNNS